MAIAFKLYLLAVLVGVVASHTAVTPQLVIEREERDQDVIRITLDEIRQRSRFVCPTFSDHHNQEC